jgi:hypothetical protein
MPLEAWGFRHVAVAILVFAVADTVIARPRQQSSQSQEQILKSWNKPQTLPSSSRPCHTTAQ